MDNSEEKKEENVEGGEEKVEGTEESSEEKVEGTEESPEAKVSSEPEKEEESHGAGEAEEAAEEEEEEIGDKEKELAEKEKELEELHKMAADKDKKGGEKEILMEISSEKIEKVFRAGSSAVMTGLKVVQKRTGKIWNKAKVKTLIPLLHNKISRLLTQLGSTIYDLNAQDEKDVLGNKNVKSIIGRVDDINEQIKLLQEKYGKQDVTKEEEAVDEEENEDKHKKKRKKRKK